MSEFPSASLVAQVKGLILQTFDVSEQEAHDYAAGLAMLAEDWGSPESAAMLDWGYRVKKDLGEKLRWKSDAEREEFRRFLEQRYKAYDYIIKRPDRA